MIYRQASLHFVRQAWKLLKGHVWPIILIFILCDAAAFATNRISHRLTNEGQHSHCHALVLLHVSPTSKLSCPSHMRTTNAALFARGCKQSHEPPCMTVTGLLEHYSGNESLEATC